MLNKNIPFEPNSDKEHLPGLQYPIQFQPQVIQSPLLQRSFLVSWLSQLGCTFYAQQGKKRSAEFNQPILLDFKGTGQCKFRLPPQHDSLGLDIQTLPSDYVILDIDNVGLASMLIRAWPDIAAQYRKPKWILVRTPRGGLHVYARKSRPNQLLPKDGACILRCAFQAECFHSAQNKHITVYGPDRTLFSPSFRDYAQFVSFLKEGLDPLPSFLEPLDVAPDVGFELLTDQIVEGRRYNTFLRLLKGWPYLNLETLNMLAWGSQPPFFSESEFAFFQKALEEKEAKQTVSPVESEIDILPSSKISDELGVVQEIEKVLKDQFIFEEESNSWFFKVDETWCPLRYDHQLLSQVRSFCLQHAKWGKQANTTKRLFWQNVIKHLELTLARGVIGSDSMLFGKQVLDRPAEGFSYPFLLRDPRAEEMITIQSPYTLGYDLKLSLEMAKFLYQLVDGHAGRINIIRSWIRSVLLLDRGQQYALALIGSASTGKTLFASLMKELLCGFDSRPKDDPRRQGAGDITFERMLNRFEISRLTHSRLLTVPEPPPSKLTGQQTSVLKILIGMEPYISEEKFKAAHSFTPRFKILFHANAMWGSVDDNAGYLRRFLIVDCPRAPKRKDPDLSTKLRASLSGLAVWALNTPAHIRNLGTSVIEINNAISSDNQIMLFVWIQECLAESPGNVMKLGAKDRGEPGTLWNSYVEFMDTNEQEICEPFRFGRMLKDALGYLGIKTELKRQRYGMALTNIAWGSMPRKEEIPGSIVHSLQHCDPFLGNIEGYPLFGLQDVGEIVAHWEEQGSPPDWIVARHHQLTRDVPPTPPSGTLRGSRLPHASLPSHTGSSLSPMVPMPPPLDPVGIRRWSSHTPMVPMGGSRGRREDLLPGPLGAEDTGSRGGGSRGRGGSPSRTLRGRGRGGPVGA